MTYLEAKIQSMQFPDSAHFVKNEALRKIFGLKKIEPHPVLIENLTILVEKGEIVSLVGPSGAGKSTLLRILAGLESRFAGKVKLGGEVVEHPSRKIQVVFQDNCLLPWLNVEDNISFAIRDEHQEAPQATAKWIERVELNEKAKDFPKTLSGGEASRVAFARTFIAPPQLLLLDEPFRALDTITKEGLQDKLIAFANDTNTTIVLVSHSIDDAVFLSNRVVALAKKPLRIVREFPVRLTGSRDRSNPELFELAGQIKEVLRAAAHAQNSIPAA